MCHIAWPEVGHIYLVGIGGIGMSAIARVLLAKGFRVSGSDLKPSSITEGLADLGATVHKGHSADHIAGADLLAVSSAVPKDNVEVVAAKAQGIPVWGRGQMLRQLMEGCYGIAIAGTHGKTTTTAMIGLILEEAGLAPTIIAGGIIRDLGANAKAGRGRYFVVEADEYDRTFLELRSKLAVVTNIEMDHPDCFGDLGEMREAFSQFISLLPEGGHLIACGEEPRVRSLAEEAASQGKIEISLYGFGIGSSWRAVDVKVEPEGGSNFGVEYEGEPFGDFSLSVPGRHNVLNGLASIACTSVLGVDKGVIQSALRGFRGVSRRFEHKGRVAGVTIIDDYAHHPTQIKATLAATRQNFPKARLWALFQPHTYSRTKCLLAEFANSFALADEVIVTEIYSAREKDSLGISSQDLVTAMEHSSVRYIGELEKAKEYLLQHLRPGDVLITMNAGDATWVGEAVAGELARRET